MHSGSVCTVLAVQCSVHAVRQAHSCRALAAFVLLVFNIRNILNQIIIIFMWELGTYVE